MKKLCRFCEYFCLNGSSEYCTATLCKHNRPPDKMANYPVEFKLSFRLVHQESLHESLSVLFNYLLEQVEIIEPLQDRLDDIEGYLSIKEAASDE